MPTGYTYKVADGTVTDFREFATECARAFGALVEMRDEPMGVEIPETFPPSTHHQRSVISLTEQLLTLLQMSPEVLQFATNKHNSEALAAWEQTKDKNEQTAARYTEMLKKAKAYQSPSPEHDAYREFMINQLREARRFDCYDVGPKPEPLTCQELFEMRFKRLTQDIAYHGKHQVEDWDRARERNEWLRLLRESLETEPSVAPVEGEYPQWMKDADQETIRNMNQQGD